MKARGHSTIIIREGKVIRQYTDPSAKGEKRNVQDIPAKQACRFCGKRLKNPCTSRAQAQACPNG